MRPTFFNALLERSVANSRARGPFDHRKHLIAEPQEVIRPSVATLLCCRCPSHVARLVVAVIVGVTINGMLWAWSRPDVGQERRKIVSPLVADRNAAPSVVSIAGESLIEASVKHALPSTEFRRLRATVRPMNTPYDCRRQAATTLNDAFTLAATENVGVERSYGSAFTPAVPTNPTALAVVGAVHCCPSSKSHASKIVESGRREASRFACPSAATFDSYTSATARTAVLQACGKNDLFLSAFTLTKPSASSRFIDAMNRCKPAEQSAGQVLEIVRYVLTLARSHEMILSQEGSLWSEPADVCASVRLALF